jgi:RHS repeat-associated protein
MIRPAYSGSPLKAIAFKRGWQASPVNTGGYSCPSVDPCGNPSMSGPCIQPVNESALDTTGGDVKPGGEADTVAVSADSLEATATTTSTPAPTAIYVYAGDQIVENGTTGYLYFQDSLGNTSHVTDAAGNLLERYTYTAFGIPTFHSANNTQLSTSAYGIRHLFQGQLWTQETGLNDYRNRVELPTMGVFLQPDPIGFKGDAANVYRFCNNNAVNRTDPMGLYTVIDVTNDFGIRGTVPGSMMGSENPAAQAYHAAVLEELCKFQEVMNSGGGHVTWTADYKEYWGEKDRDFRLKTATSEWETESAAYKDTDGVISHFSEGLHLKTHWNEDAKPEDIRRAQSTNSWYGEIGHIRDATDHGTRRSPGQLDSLRAIADRTANSMIGQRISTQEAAQRMQNALTRWVTETMKNSKDTYDHWPYHVH